MAQAITVGLVTAFVMVALAWLFLGMTSRGFAAVASVMYPGAVYRLPVEDKLIALTMDDGPSTEYTEPILDVLQEYGAKATFFLISDYVAGNEPTVRRIVDEGHEIGHHMKTGRASLSLPPEEFAACFDEAEQVLDAYAPITWYRPGSGLFDDRMRTYAESRGYRLVLGNLHPFDVNIRSVRFATGFILRGANPGAIIVLHDGGHRGERCVETLKAIVPALQARGYRFVTLSELAATAESGDGRNE